MLEANRVFILKSKIWLMITLRNQIELTDTSISLTPKLKQHDVVTRD